MDKQMHKPTNKIEKLINELCPDGVKFMKLGETCEIKTGKGITKKDSSDLAQHPIISGGKKPMGYYDKYNRQENTVTISRVGANAGYVSFINTRFYLNDKCFSVLPVEKYRVQIKNKFLFYYLKANESYITGLQSEGGVPTINTAKVSKISIPIPPLTAQEEIVKILDNFTELEAELEAELETELEARKKQYAYFQEELLTFGNEVEFKELGEFGELIGGSGLPKTDFTESGVGCIHYGQIYTYYGIYTNNTKSFVSEESAKKLKKVKQGDIIIAKTSENVEDLCKSVVYLGEDEIVTGGHTAIFRHKQNPKFISYYINGAEGFQIQKRKYAIGVKVKDVSLKNLTKIKIPIPPIQEQKRIVKILDKFDALVNDISIGLSTELKARRSQYEYYREKLLTFKEKTLTE